MFNLKKNDVKQSTVGLLFLLPNILGFLVFTAVPLVISLFMAFTDWNLEMHNMFQTATVKSVGFGNFVKLFTDPDFFTYLGNTLFLMIGIPVYVWARRNAAEDATDEKEKHLPVFTKYELIGAVVIVVVAIGAIIAFATGKINL